MRGEKVSLPEMLEAREQRVGRQREMLRQRGLPLVSFTMNIAGEIKRDPRVDFAFDYGMERLAALCGEPVAWRRSDGKTGPEILLAYERDLAELKALCRIIEEESPVGRLYDMDVIGRDGGKLGRDTPRRCLVCGGPVAVCSRSRAHGLDAIVGKTEELLNGFTARRLGELAVRALKEEAELTPKPGLVDRADNGAHEDMDLALFLKSADALLPYYCEAARLGLEQGTDAMPELQEAGKQAEECMFAATGGVNTHKGAVYILGLLAAALGSCAVRGGCVWDVAAALAEAGFNRPDGTHGAEVRRRYGAVGAREEALEGFPTVQAAVEALRNGEDAFGALLTVMSLCRDSNLLYRGGKEALAFARQEAKKALDLQGEERLRALEEMNRLFIERRWSPGGCADVLAAALLVRSAEALVYCEK